MGENSVIFKNLHEEINPEEHGFKVMLEGVGTEADQANRRLDFKINHHRAQTEGNGGAHDESSLKEAIMMDQLANDRDNVVTMSQNDVLKKRSEFKVAEEDQRQPEYPFGDGELIYAFYGNDARNLITFFLRMPDNSVQNHTIDKSNQHGPAWFWVKKTFTETELNEATKREISKINRMRKREEDEVKEMETKRKQEDLFQAKIDAFEIPIVADAQNRDVKSQIRKAKSIMEVTAYVGALVALEQIKKEQAATNEQ